MASPLLLINPKNRRRKTRKANPVKTRKTRRASPQKRRHHNPIALRKANPGTYRRRRRSNPSMRGFGNQVMPAVKDAAIGGAGAIAVDYAMGNFVRDMLPTSLQNGYGYAAIKAALTLFAGIGLASSTKGLSRKAAAGALVVQAYDILNQLLPADTKLGYVTYGGVVNGSPLVRTYPGGMGAVVNNQAIGQLGAVVNNAAIGYRPMVGAGQALGSARDRENVTPFR
jgi:hypothetical protein